MVDGVEVWLKSTIPGIIILGALGSLLALGILKGVIYLAGRVMPLPYQLHRKNSMKQAYFLGGMHACMSNDKTNKLLTSFLAYHFLLFIAALGLFLVFVLFFSLAILIQSTVALTIGTFLSVTAAFLSLYWCYYESQYIYRTYLTHWKSEIESIQNSFLDYEENLKNEEPNNKIKEDAA